MCITAAFDGSWLFSSIKIGTVGFHVILYRCSDLFIGIVVWVMFVLLLAWAVYYLVCVKSVIITIIKMTNMPYIYIYMRNYQIYFAIKIIPCLRNVNAGVVHELVMYVNIILIIIIIICTGCINIFLTNSSVDVWFGCTLLGLMYEGIDVKVIIIIIIIIYTYIYIY